MTRLTLACLAAVLLSVLAFFQAQTNKQLHNQVYLEEQYSKDLSAELAKNAAQRLELLRRLAALEQQLLAASNTPAIESAGSSNVNDSVPEDVDEERREDISQNGYRTIVSGDGSSVRLMLDIPPGPGPVWKPIEELRASIENLDEELDFAIESQDEEFRTVDMTAYSDFLDSINLDAPTKQNILTQLADTNREVFSRMLADAVELQANGYVAAVQHWANDGEYAKRSQTFSPADVMDSNLNQDQLQEFFDFEATRQSQRIDSTDERITEMLGKLDLIP